MLISHNVAETQMDIAIKAAVYINNITADKVFHVHIGVYVMRTNARKLGVNLL